MATVEQVRIPTRLLSDGRQIWLYPLLFTYRLAVGSPSDLANYDEAWCFHDFATAMEEFLVWDPAIASEPSRWHRHPTSGRRRPDGDPTKEYCDI